MSYCRFSSDNHLCELYVYADCNGYFVTYVAGRRWIEPPPKLTRWDDPGFHASYEAQSKWMKENEDKLQPIGIDLKENYFRDDTLEELKERLLWLRGLGFKFPDYVLTEIDEEMAEESTAST
jgi:hypothetical protein